jgi:hypothetical protein
MNAAGLRRWVVPWRRSAVPRTFRQGVRRPGRRQRLAASLGVAVELTGAGAVAAPQRIVAAVAGHAAALAIVAASRVAGQLEAGYLQCGILLVATVAAATAAAVDRRELRAMASVDLCGASALQRRLVVVVEAVLLAVAALPLGLAAGAAACLVAGAGEVRVLPAVAAATVVPAVVALGTGRVRSRVTVTDASAGQGRDGPVTPREIALLRCVGGVALVAIAVFLSRHLRAFWELDLALGPLVVLAAAGLALALPPVVDGVGHRLARAGSLPVALAGNALSERRRLLAPAATLGAVAAMVVTIQAVVGLGLAEREQARRERFGGPDRFTVGLGDRDVFVGRTDPLLPFLGLGFPPDSIEPDMHPALPGEMADGIRQALPGARVAGVEALPVDPMGDPLAPRLRPYQVVVGTPDLLAALGLGRFAGDLAEGRALVLDPTAAVDGRVVLQGHPIVASGLERSLPARVVQRRVVPQYQPSVLVPAAVGRSVREEVGSPDGWPHVNPAALVVGGDRAFTDAELGLIEEAVRVVPATSRDPGGRVTVLRGDHRIPGALDENRLDDSSAIVLDSPADVRLAVLVAVAVALVALAVALRLAALTGRPDDELLEMLGARPATLRRAAVGQALVLGLLAVPLGGAVGVLAARVGLAGYNGRGRFADGVELPPIPFAVPGALVVGAVVVPVVAALVAGALALRRPPADPRSLADRLAW